MKIGVLGAGHLGKIHLKLLKEISSFELVGFYDPDKTNAKKVSEEFEIPKFDTITELIDAVQVVDIVTPTLSHFDCASKAIRASKHVFIEKPITNTVEEAKILMNLAEEAQVKVQIGHVERFNPAFTAAQPSIKNPMFIETHRLAQFNPRGTDVSVVLDLMIHDLDIILSVVKGNVKKISASGVSVISNTPDIANARIELDNGCVANLTASRISMKNLRKSRFSQKDAYISVDFLDRALEVVKIDQAPENPDPFALVLDLGEGKEKKIINFNKPKIEPNNAIKDELASFADAILSDSVPAVTIHDGYSALDLAHQIVQKIRTNSSLEVEG